MSGTPCPASFLVDPALQGSGFRLHCFATATPPFQSGLGSVCKSCKRLKLHLYNITEISFGRNGKRNMAENSFARSDRRERKSYYRARGCINNPLNFQTEFAGSGAQNLFPLINILPAVAVQRNKYQLFTYALQGYFCFFNSIAL